MRTVHGVQRLQDDEDINGDEGFYVSESGRGRQLNIGATRSKLTIRCMTSDMAGEYTCVADIPTDRIATTTQVHVGE